ncbi:D-2-hydroxyacid dehydrogenase [Alkalihalophilus marmarensis]|uniref:Hydroxyacid dehydrogenase n=1 Tax=Alkalihalophilus marmarensis DSM 21297 TaxID=1188261 RepID=U6SUN3_9BACI|nr:D-2-hydroxyacid dehydrogenase [Alkalihalophilus marmarensis]ERN54351.1 hydroxyacid dehydrogenase [Alkalihalophilus marmarensis DSM 21297]MCM3488274.1 D-2-hydroxyacid dehydrogenase [Alkalihalophilus marmarensis]
MSYRDLNISTVLIISPMYGELKRLIEKENVEQSFRFKPEDEVTDEDLDWADAVACFNTQTDFNYSKVKWVHSLGAGVDRFLHNKTWDKEVLLTRTICSFGQRIAEYTLSYVLQDLQHHQLFQKDGREKLWKPRTPGLLKNSKAVIYGTGEIGQVTAKVLSQFAMEVYGVSRSGRKKDFFKKVFTIDQQEHTDQSEWKDADYIINTLPLTVETEALFNRQFFSQFTEAGFINVGRGASVDEEALIEALDDDRLRFAVLDVFKEEPLPSGHPFWEHPNITITPHISAVTTADEAVACFIDTLRNIERNEALVNQVDIKKGY